MVDQRALEAPNPPAGAITVFTETRGAPPRAGYSVRHEQVDGNRGRNTQDASVTQPATGLKP
jgi:hypothetical protein